MSSTHTVYPPCTACDTPFETIQSWEWRHSPHDEGCGFKETGRCYCSNEVHDFCCPCDSIVAAECAE